MIRTNIELEARLIEDMLDLSRIARGKLSLHRSAHDIHGILRHVVEIVRPTATEKNLILESGFADGPAIVSGDPARLKQIFLNLLNNAIKFTPDGGGVRLRTTIAAPGREVDVEVTDSGMGMTEAELKRAFEPFVQGLHADENRSSFGGLGLGLAIVRDLVERHGGRVSAHSLGRGRGATFTVVLPLAVAAADAAASRSNPPADRPVAGTGLRILLVEDHGHTRTALERMLSRRGHRIRAADSKQAAITAAREQKFDVLVSDIGLPDGDGYQLMTEVKAILPGIYGIALSGFGMESDVQRSAAAGFATHLVKPVSMKQIEAALEKLPATD
jgi:CheY-like chemotaxis protein